MSHDFLHANIVHVCSTTSLKHIDKDVYAPLGWAIIDDLLKMGVDNVKELTDIPRAFDLLQANRIAGFACLETVADFYLRANQKKYQQQ